MRCLLLHGFTAFLVCVPLSVSAETPAEPGGDGLGWSKRFPFIAGRISHLDQRMASKDEKVRLRVLTELTYFRPRDSEHYPPFFRALLEDPSPEIRWKAVTALRDHHHFLPVGQLPPSFDVPLVGLVKVGSAEDLARCRQLAASPGPIGGWATAALAILGDKQVIPIARQQLSSENVFVRFSAATALTQLGQRKDGIDALHRITDSVDDASGYYRYRAAETLFRFGETRAIEVLFRMLEDRTREGYADDPRSILTDLTGQYFETGADARRWWKAHKDSKPK